jgi:triosephosphate isomerase
MCCAVIPSAANTIIGETREQYEAGQTQDVLKAQIAGCVPAGEEVVIAYEPVWAIGTGLTPTVEEIAAAHAFIHSLVVAPVLYGGSAKPENIEAIMACEGVDGALVGSASLDGESFAAMLRAL